MTDLQIRLAQAIETAAEYEMLGSLAADRDKREEYRTLARFHQSIANELRREIGTPIEAHQLKAG